MEGITSNQIKNKGILSDQLDNYKLDVTQHGERVWDLCIYAYKQMINM